MAEYDDPFSEQLTPGQRSSKHSNRRLLWGILGCFGVFIILVAAFSAAGYFGFRFVQSRVLAERGAVAYEEDDYEKAIESLDLALEIDPNYQEALLVRADCLRLMGEYEKALEDCDHLIERNPKFAEVYNIRGLIHDDQGDSQKALTDFLKSLELGNSGPVILSNVAMTYYDMEDYERALDYINRAVADSPRNPYFNYHRGLVLYEQENYEAALADFELCVKRNKPILSFGVNIPLEEIEEYYVDCLTELERFDELERLERQAIENEPLNVTRYHELRGTFMMQEKYDEAEQLLDEALARIKDEEDRHSLCSGWAYTFIFEDDEQLKQRGVEIAKKHVAETNASSESLQLLASIHEWQENWDEAVSVYTRLIEQEPRYLMQRAMCHRQLKEFEKALTDLDELEKSGEPLDSEFYRELAITHAAMEHFEKAVEAMTKCIETALESGETDYDICYHFEQRAQYQEEQGDIEQAEQDLNRAVNADEECQSCRRVRVKFYMRHGRYEDALRDSNTLIRQREDDSNEYSLDNDARYYKLRAEVYDKLNESEKAEKDRQKAAELRAAYEERWGPVDDDEYEEEAF